MTGIAIDGCVGASERESIVVLLHLLDGNLPSAYGVALLAIRAELALMNVGVAVLAALPDIAEYGFHMALRASHGLVHSAQRVLRPVVIELRDGADRLPSACCVTVLAWNVQIAVRTMSTLGNLRMRSSRNSGQGQHQYCEQLGYAPRLEHVVPQFW